MTLCNTCWPNAQYTATARLTCPSLQRRSRLLRGTHLKVAEASIEDIDYETARGLDKRQTALLASGERIRRHRICSSPGQPSTRHDAHLATSLKFKGYLIKILCARTSFLSQSLDINTLYDPRCALAGLARGNCLLR